MPGLRLNRVQLGSVLKYGIVSELGSVPFGLDIATGGGTNYTYRKKTIIHPCKNPQLVHVNMGRIRSTTNGGIGKSEGIEAADVAINVQASLERFSGTIHQSAIENVPTGIKLFPAIPIEIPTKEQCWIRSYADINSVAKFRNGSQGLDGFSNINYPNFNLGGEGKIAGNSTASGVIPTAYDNAAIPTIYAVVGLVKEKTAVFVIGDSTSTVQVGSYIWDGIAPWWQLAFHNTLPYCSAGCGQDLANNIALPYYNAKRMSLAKYCKTSILMVGINDVNNGRTAAQIIADYKTICDTLKSNGITKVYITTISPMTTSTDGWQTLANQTLVAGIQTVRQSVNSQLRSGALDGYATVIDVAATTENATTGKWACDETLYFTGIPSSKTSHRFTFTGQAWSIDQFKGKMLYSVTQNVMALITSNTANTINTISSAIAATDTIRIINPMTKDGTHYSFNGDYLISGLVKTAYGINSALTPPDITLPTQTSITDTTATVGATLDCKGLSTTWSIEYGATTAYGSIQTGGITSENGAKTVGLTGLASDSQLHWRFKAVNSDGTTYSADQTLSMVGIPLSTDALFWLDGLISGNQLLDKSGNNRHFTITNKDFPSAWLAGVPYKSQATISAPVGDATLISADVNNFLYAAGGTPNQIPVTALFSDVNYAHKLFCRQYAQVVDVNGVETDPARVLDIVLYNTVKSDADLVHCNTYFGVNAKLTSNFRDVGVGKTYTTITAAMTAAATGDTIYIHNGVYQEASFISVSKQLKLVGVGLVQINGVTDRVISKSGATIYFDCEGITFNDGKTYGIAVTASGSVLNKFNRCTFTNLGTQFSYDSSNGYQFTNCIISSTGYINAQLKYIVLNSCIFKNVLTPTLTSDSTIVNSIVTCDAAATVSKNMFPLGDINFTFKGNRVVTRNNMIADANSTMAAAKNVDFKYNNVSILNVAGGTISYAPVNLTGYTTNKYIVNFTDNVISQVGQISINNLGYGLIVKDHQINVLRNVFTSESLLYFTEISKTFNSGTATNGADTISYNFIRSSSTSSTCISLGGELGLLNRCDNSVIVGNYVEAVNTQNAAGHGLLLSCGKNMTVKFNKVKNAYNGIVVKTGLMDTYTGNGLSYNLVSGAVSGIYVRGVRGLNVFNNTVTDCSFCLRIDQNLVQAGSQWSENVIAKNNILKNVLNANTLIGMDAHAAANGCLAENNQLYGGQYLLSDGTNYSDLATANAAGKLLNSVVADPSLSANLIPATPISGIDLSVAYNTGLDVLSTFGNVTTTPIIVTKGQPLVWQKGAFIQ